MASRLTFYLLLQFISFGITGQDIQFSQYNAIGAYYNPAASGFFGGNFLVGSIYRNQWVGLQDQPFVQLAISGEIKFLNGDGLINKDFIGAGVYFATDRSQLFDWNKNEMVLHLAYHKLLDKRSESYLSGGLSFGLVQRSVNYDNLYFEDQFDGLDAYSRPTGELLPANIHAVPVLKIGLRYQTSFSRSWGLELGLSADKLLAADHSFFNGYDNPDYTGTREAPAFRNFVAIANLRYAYTRVDALFPRIYFFAQGPHRLLQTGVHYRKLLPQKNASAIYAGLSGRWSNRESSLEPVDLGMLLGFEINQVTVGLQYDIGIRDASKYNSPTHSFELSLRIAGDYDRRRQTTTAF
ncbi:MAG: PorP/SprF family type IX secretion system membrane protein [Saprospiraceae bacterium]|nr:PorP/SprF family type IX secretion system membrane protein [Saprospiraceae bacterium]